MSADCVDATSWATWATVHDLPQELLKKFVGDVGEAEQGWPPGMMDEVSLRILYDMGVKNTRFAEALLSPYPSALCAPIAASSYLPPELQ